MDFREFVKAIIVYLSLISIFNHALALNNCDFPAIFNLGDSNSDTGGLSAAFRSLRPPYGKTYFHRPVGRYSDGRLIIDFIAEGLGLRYLSAYLDSVGANFTNGANFATAGSTIVPTRNTLPLGCFSPFSLNVQLIQFTQFKSESQFVINNNQGGIFKDLLPKKEYFDEALYTFDIGQNDLGQGFFSGISVQEVNASVPDIVNNFSTIIKSVYRQGGRSFWIHNTGPIGCLPYILTFATGNNSKVDKAGCAIAYNEVAQYFNRKLKEAVSQLRKELPSAAITYVDIYSAKYNLISQANKYGFEHPLTACCGYGGGEYNYSTQVRCGGTITVNGTQVTVGSCKRPWARVTWDGVHYTEAANKWIYHQIVDGTYSDPPLSLRMACHNVKAMYSDI